MEKKKTVIYSIVALTTLALLVVGATYAYFQNQYGSASNADIKVTTYTTDVLTFETGDAINISADQETFAQGKGNRTGSTFARATLQANNKTNTATANYYMYLNIENNTFTYTNAGTPELILQVVDKTSGNPVTSITSLDYVTVTDGKNTSISGFDITTKNGLITLFSNKEISASPKTVEEYTITITLVNHSFDQNANTGKSFSGKLIIQKEKIVQTVANICKNGQSLSSCIAAMDGIDETLYHHDANLTNGAGDNSYRYAGTNPNNYVCFGSDDTTCPHENLYRIIGVIDGKVKLILADGATTDMLGTNEGYVNTYGSSASYTSYKGNGDLTKIGKYKWNKTSDNTWSTSTTNTTNLNTNYLTYLDSKNTKWKNMIADTTWYVGGMTRANGAVSNAKTAYNYEVGANKDVTTTVNAKIGLMYVSDYGFAAAPSAWTTILNNYKDATIKNENWLYIGLYEWTISRRSGDSGAAFYVDVVGYVYVDGVGYIRVLRPSFSLSSSIKFTSGEGTAVNPIRINL